MIRPQALKVAHLVDLRLAPRGVDQQNGEDPVGETLQVGFRYSWRVRVTC